MVGTHTDPVLKGVGAFLVIALIAWIGLAVVLPPAPADAEQKVTKFTSSGKYLDKSCCSNPDQKSSGCAKAAFSGCPKDAGGWTKAECNRYQGEKGCQNRKNCQSSPSPRA